MHISRRMATLLLIAAAVSFYLVHLSLITKTVNLRTPRLPPVIQDVSPAPIIGAEIEEENLEEENTLVCFVVRTSLREDHDRYEGITRFMDSLERLENQDWIALFIVADQRPFRRLQSRITARLKRGKYGIIDVPKELRAVKFRKGVSGMDKTDYAIEKCPSNTRWLIVTNADNEHRPRALNHLDPAFDIIRMDFFSRYVVHGQFTESGLPPELVGKCEIDYYPWCMNNVGTVSRTDLGANILNWPRLMKAGVRFMHFRQTDEQDGLMMEHLTKMGWKSKHVKDCLLEHNPNPWSCCRAGGKMPSVRGRCYFTRRSKMLKRARPLMVT